MKKEIEAISMPLFDLGLWRLQDVVFAGLKTCDKILDFCRSMA
jgi:hypothetical protein